VFIRLDTADMITLMVPYVALEEEARYCLRALIAAELQVSESQICVDTICLDTKRHDCPPEVEIRSRLPCIVDIGPQAELTIEACAAVARVMLIRVAAEVWGLSTKVCRAVDGMVIGATSDQCVLYGEVAAHAAWHKMPGSVQLRSGRLLDLSSPLPARHGSAVQANRSCEPEVRQPVGTD
jgi:hypothetical protein